MSEFEEDTFLVFGIKSHSVRSTRPKRENLGLGEFYAEFESMEFHNLFMEGPRDGDKVKVDNDLPHRPFDVRFDVRCLINIRGKEPLLASVIMGFGGVLVDGCQ